MNSRRFIQVVLAGTITVLALVGGATAVLDPFFHYHKPLDGMEYPMEDGKERYLNDGIIRHFDYDAAIAGTSMMQNFKTSQFDELFGLHSIKVTYTAETYYAIDQEVRKILEKNPETRCIFRCLDYKRIFQNGEVRSYDSYPDYLYDDNIFNDVNYLFNKEVFLGGTLKVISYNLEGKKTTSMDEYSSWADEYPVGREYVLTGYQRAEEEREQTPLTQEDRQRVIDNVTDHVVRTVEEHPDTMFYFYTPPYSIAWWDSTERSGAVLQYLEAEKLQAELLLPYDNVRLYTFSDQYEIVENLDNYMDTTHYGPKISDKILDWIHEGTGLLTQDNYEEKIRSMEEFYLSYDYDQIFDETADA